ncbi:MAG TPA: hypothetical protein VJ901_17245 [Thermoanaerobaculia bacterium]|nr:hypothetical protein [Thermoanaerobaculia bacterium]
MRDIHRPYDFFEFSSDPLSPADASKIDVAILDMNHAWPNLGHDALVHAVLECAEGMRDELVSRGLKVRVISFDVRRQLAIPPSPNGRFRLYIGTGGPGHLDPRCNDGVSEVSQGIKETDEWEAPLFRLFDDIQKHPDAALLGVCHSFGLICRWSGVAHPRLREKKSDGMPINALSPAASDHPWFAEFSRKLDDGRHFVVVDNRLFDLVLDGSDVTPLAFDADGSDAMTMAEFARSGDMPRILGVNHHPEIIDRDHVLQVVEEKWRHGEVSRKWYEERLHTLENEMTGDNIRRSRLTSEYTLLGVLRHHLAQLVAR